MAYDERLRLVVLAAREAGLATLRGLAERADRLRVCALYTHRLRPKSEDPTRQERPEFAHYADLALDLDVPLHVVDAPSHAHRLASLQAYLPFDVLLSVNWRYMVPADVLSRPRIAAINLHRGKLPEYAGAEPVRRALQAGDDVVTLTAHLMTEEVDAGPVLVERSHEMGPLLGPTLADDVARVKRELCPLYPHAAIEAIEKAARSEESLVKSEADEKLLRPARPC